MLSSDKKPGNNKNAHQVLMRFLVATLFMGVLVAEISAQCDYQQTLVPGSTYQVFSPGYAANYKAGQRCTWQGIAPPGYKIVLNCPTIVIPCNQDQFVINKYGQWSGSGDLPLCGSGSTTVESLTNAMSVRLTTTTGNGKFYCTMKTAVDSCQCGRRQTARIVGGTTAGVNEFPYQVLLTDATVAANPVCGAALISEYYVLTAAHCVASRTTSNTKIVVGEHTRSTPSETPYTAKYDVSALIPHSGYVASTGANDIALVKSWNEISLNYGVGIACLPWLYTSQDFASYMVTVAGWGTTEFGGPLSNNLLKTDVQVISNSQCSSSFSQATSSNYMCTFYAGRDTCQYDSGTNAMLQLNGRMYSVGVTSGGSGCASSTPALNMRVTQYLSWIKAQATGATFCSI